MKIIKAIFELIRDAALRWSEDKASMFAAALAYYTVFSLAPLIVLGIAIAKRILQEPNVKEILLAYITRNFDPEIAKLITQMSGGNTRETSTVLATVIGTIILLWGATGVFNHLKRALNTIWGVEPELPNGLQGVIYFMKTRGLTSLMVLGVGFLFVVAFILNTIMSMLNQYALRFFPQFSKYIDGTLVNFILSWVIPLVAFAIVLKILPDAKVAWRDVWLGALVTAVLFGIGNYAISFYLSRSNVASAYGAAGSLIVMLLWIYYSAQIFFFGAEFTQVFANRYGSKVIPSSHAVAIRRERVSNHEPRPEPELLPAYLPEPLYLPDAGDSPSRQKAKHLGFGMIGLAIGLFLGFLGSLNRD